MVFLQAHAVIELDEILGDAARYPIHHGGVLLAHIGHETTAFAIVERHHLDLRGPTPVQRALIPQHLALHETHTRPGEDEHELACSMMLVDQLLEQ